MCDKKNKPLNIVRKTGYKWSWLCRVIGLKLWNCVYRVLNWFQPFYPFYKLSLKGGRQAGVNWWGTFFAFFSFISLLGLCMRGTSGLIKKQLVTSAAAFRDVNTTDRSTASAPVICRRVITFGPPPGHGGFTTVTRSTSAEHKEKSKRMETTSSDNTVISCNHNWDFLSG